MQDEQKKKVSAAQIAATKKYKIGKYRKLSVDVKCSEFDTIDNFCKSKGITKARFIVNATNYFINRDIIPTDDNTIDTDDTD